MITIKGFFTINSKIDNTVDTVSPIGELSDVSRTYSRHTEIYHHDDYTGYRFTLFNAYHGEEVPLDTIPENVNNSIFKLGDWINSYVENNITEPDTDVITEALKNAFPEYTSVKVYEQVLVGSDWYPSSVNVESESFQLRLWMSDSHFLKEYSDYEILVIHPVVPLDEMLAPYIQFKELLDSYDYNVNVNRISEITSKYPATAVRPLTYNWYDQNNSSLSLTVSWTVIIYGGHGDTLEATQDAVVANVQNESDGTDIQWITAVPELFSPTEFRIVPMWHKVAMQDGIRTNKIYSPVTSTLEQNKLANMFMEEDEIHVRDYTESTCTIYKSMSFIALGKSTNRNDDYGYSDIYPDYIIVSTASSDFARMSLITQGWVLLLNNMLAAADDYAITGELPPGVIISQRDDVDYLLSTYHGINHLIAERTTTLKKIEAQQHEKDDV